MSRREASARADAAQLSARLGSLREEAHALRTEPLTVESAMRRELRLKPQGVEVVRVGSGHESWRPGETPPQAPVSGQLERFLRPFALDRFFRVAVFVLCCAMLLCAFAVSGLARSLRSCASRGA